MKDIVGSNYEKEGGGGRNSLEGASGSLKDWPIVKGSREEEQYLLRALNYTCLLSPPASFDISTFPRWPLKDDGGKDWKFGTVCKRACYRSVAFNPA